MGRACFLESALAGALARVFGLTIQYTFEGEDEILSETIRDAWRNL